MVLNQKWRIFFLSPPLTTFVCRLEVHAIEGYNFIILNMQSPKIDKVRNPLEIWIYVSMMPLVLAS